MEMVVAGYQFEKTLHLNIKNEVACVPCVRVLCRFPLKSLVYDSY